MSLYLALTLPLPFLAEVSSTPISPVVLWLGIVLGFIALVGTLSEQVQLDEEKIQVVYPGWVPYFWGKRWSLAWSEIKALKLRTTGQGGLVYYFISRDSERVYLLPMRVAGFARLVNIVGEKTGINKYLNKINCIFLT
jgi:hypothetical protein